MAERLQLRRDTAAQWEAVNPILRLCEIGLVVDLAGHVTGMKIGDGRVWNALPLIPIAEKVGTSMIADGAVTADKIAEGVIPTKVSELTNDENYAKTSAIPTKVSQLTNDAQYAKTSAIPTKVSQLSNDSGYLNEAFAENLILNSRFGGNAEKWEGSGYQVLNDIHERGVSGVTITEGTISQRVDDLEEGYYTLSFWQSGFYGENYLYVQGDCDNFTSDFGEGNGEDGFILPNQIARKRTVHFYCYGGRVEVIFEASGEMSISEVKLEKAKKASGFSLNTLDIVDKYTGGSDNLILNADFLLKAPDSTPIGWTLTATPDKYIFGKGYVTIKGGRAIKQTVNLEVGKRYMLKLNVSSMNIGEYPCILMTIKNATDIYVDGTKKTSTMFPIDYNKQPVDEHTIVFTANGSTEIVFESDDDGYSSSPSISGISLVCAGEGTEVY